MKPKLRRVLGIFLGLLLGLVYGAVSHLINVFFLPAVPLYHSSPGRLGTIFLIVLGGGLLGMLAAWTEEFIPGVIASSLVLTLIASLGSMITTLSDGAQLFRYSVLLFLTFLPRVIFFLPAAALLLWVLHTWEEGTLHNPYILKKPFTSSFVLVALGIIAGLFSLYSPQERASLADLNQMIQEGMQAVNTEELPPALIPVNGFFENAQGAYSLRLIPNPDKIPVQRPIVSTNTVEHAIIVMFKNGFRFGCVYSPPHPQPNCKDF